MPRLTPVIGHTTPAGHYTSTTLAPEATQHEIDAAVLAAFDAGGRNVAVRFCDDLGRCRHLATYPDNRSK